MTTDLGPTYTKGSSYRARAEARQRHYRAEQLAVGWREWGSLGLQPDAGRVDATPRGSVREDLTEGRVFLRRLPICAPRLQREVSAVVPVGTRAGDGEVATPERQRSAGTSRVRLVVRRPHPIVGVRDRDLYARAVAVEHDRGSECRS